MLSFCYANLAVLSFLQPLSVFGPDLQLVRGKFEFYTNNPIDQTISNQIGLPFSFESKKMKFDDSHPYGMLYVTDNYHTNSSLIGKRIFFECNDHMSILKNQNRNIVYTTKFQTRDSVTVWVSAVGDYLQVVDNRIFLYLIDPLYDIHLMSKIDPFGYELCKQFNIIPRNMELVEACRSMEVISRSNIKFRATTDKVDDKLQKRIDKLLGSPAYSDLLSLNSIALLNNNFDQLPFESLAGRESLNIFQFITLDSILLRSGRKFDEVEPGLNQRWIDSHQRKIFYGKHFIKLIDRKSVFLLLEHLFRNSCIESILDRAADAMFRDIFLSGRVNDPDIKLFAARYFSRHFETGPPREIGPNNLFRLTHKQWASWYFEEFIPSIKADASPALLAEIRKFETKYGKIK